MKKRILLGLLIIMAMSIIGAFIGTAPTVFAAENDNPAIETEIAGDFTGEGYYETGDTVTLDASMRPGYEFKGWIIKDSEGNIIDTILTEECSFVVEEDVYVEATWGLIAYKVNFASDLLDGMNKLKDFYDADIVNINDVDGNYYYDNKLQIKLTPKTYLYTLDSSDITINNNMVSEMGNKVKCDIEVVNGVLQSINITLNIKEDITIDIDYKYMYTFTILSGNDIDISNVVDFVQVGNATTKIDDYTYLAPANTELNLGILPDSSIYKFVRYKLEGYDYSDVLPPPSHILTKNITFTIEYEIKKYDIIFNSYVINKYEQLDTISPLYNIPTYKIPAGQTIGFDYNNSTKQVTITDQSTGKSTIYDYIKDVYGYSFVGFAYNNNILTESTYSLSLTPPDVTEIQLVFDYIEYNITIELIDEYFEDGVMYSYTYLTDTSKLVTQTEVKLYAESTKYIIVGWENIPSETTPAIIKTDISNTCIFVFNPISDDQLEYTITLNLDYKYSSATYSLNTNSIQKNMDYDVVKVSWDEQSILFVDSESLVPDINVEFVDVVTNGDKTLIYTNEMGTITISQNSLSYVYLGNKVTSIEKTVTDGVEQYTFNKYTYYADLQLNIIKHLTLVEDGTNAIVTINGIKCNETLSLEQGEITKITTTIEYNDAKGGYRINSTSDFPYEMYLYKKEDGTTYDYIEFKNVKYYYNDGIGFILKYAENVEANATIATTAVKNYNYSITVGNLLPDTLIMYSTKSTNNTLYGFASFADASGGILGYYTHDTIYRSCVLNVSEISSVSVEYVKLENAVRLYINNENAFKLENVSFTVNGVAGENGSNSIMATDGAQVVISILLNDTTLTPGYQFDGFMLNGVDITNDDNPSELSFIMDSSYINQIIVISFSEIKYTLNINYIDDSGNVLNPLTAHGIFKLNGSDTTLTSIEVVLNEQYTFNAVPNIGYYVGNAYIGSDGNTLTELISDNLSNSATKTWILNELNFKMLIIEQANAENQINLYIYFATHTYDVKIYFEIPTNPELIQADTYINGVKYDIRSAEESQGGFLTTKYFVEANNFTYNSSVNINIDVTRLGMTFKQLNDYNNLKITDSSNYTLTGIASNTTFIAELQYVLYTLNFEYIDEAGNECNYGSAQSNLYRVKLNDYIVYSVTCIDGYILHETYTHDATDAIVYENIDGTGFRFNPINFKIYENHSFNIFLVFKLKSIQISVSNSTEGNMYFYEGYNVEDLATFTMSRQRGDNITQLTGAENYDIQTGDILSMELVPRVGISLQYLDLGGVISIYKYTSGYSIVENKIYDSDLNVIGIKYNIEIKFEASVIKQLDGVVSLKNVLYVNTYEIEYSYNYIEYEFEITLAMVYADNPIWYGGVDEAMYVTAGFGETLEFDYLYEGMNSEVTNKFRIEGFSIDGTIHKTDSYYVLTGEEMWSQIAVNKYNNNKVSVVLLLNPKIVLQNYTSNKDGYLYSRVYNGEEQGLTTVGENPDIKVGEKFTVVIKYSMYEGDNYTTTMPIDVGIYWVQISAKIISGSNSQDVPMDEKIQYQITEAPITIKFKTYNKDNPITKEYDGTVNLSSNIVIEDIELDGAFKRDKIRVDKTRLSAKYWGVSANNKKTDKLYNIDIFDIYLLDGSNNSAKNYYLSNGKDVVIENVGLIMPKQLHITGFKVKNKVYSEPTDKSVDVDLSGIIYQGKLETDSSDILEENLKFYLEDNSIGYAREVKLNWEGALVGADSTNYTITYDTKYIDIHPYERTCTVDKYGTFKIVDQDKKCLIPINAEIIVRVYESGTSEYRALYSRLESQIERGQKLKICYEVVLRVGVVEQIMPEGLYLYIPKTNKTTKIIQAVDNENIENIEYSLQKDYTAVKVQSGDAVLGIIVKTTYLPLWLIMLIILLIILLIIIIVLIFMWIRRKAKNKYSKYDRI